MLIRTVVIFFALAIISCAQISGPKIYSANTTFDFGNIEQNTKLKHSFVILNNGGDTLVISRVITSCGCTVAQPEKKILLPNESTTLNVEFDATNREGEQKKYITVYSNDTATPQLRFTISGNVFKKNVDDGNHAIIEFEETQHDFGKIEEGSIVSFTFRFKNTGTQDLEIKDVKTSCGCTAAVVSGNLLKPGETGTIKIDFDSSNRSGRTSRTITVISNDPNNAYKVLTIFAEILPKQG